MLRLFAVSLLLTATLLVADEKNTAKLAAPEGWSGETIAIPPGLAPDMKLKGSEHIRFAPGMMKPASDSFFSYVRDEEATEAEFGDSDMDQDRPKLHLCRCLSSGARDGDLETTARNP